MALTKQQKQKSLEALTDRIARQKALVFFDFTGLKVKDFSDFRKKMKREGNEIKVAKKTLLALVLKKAGLEFDVKKLKGEIALAFGFKDEISPAKLCYQFSLTNLNLKILGGFFEGKARAADEIIALAQIPSRDELLVKLLGSISSPISNFVYSLRYNLKGLVCALSAIKK